MKIVVAPDSFKGNMRSAEVCKIIEEALRSGLPDADIRCLPMADGGEGTVEALVTACGGRTESLKVTGPLGDPADAQYAILDDGTAVVEMASASGIELVPPGQLNPMAATTCGTGELLLHLAEKGIARVIIGVGGSATVDGGVGMAQALGFRFFDAAGNELTERGGGMLARIARIEGQSPELALRVACDVTNPLTGPDGAAAVFGPQKGATPEMVAELDAGLANLRQVAGGTEQAGDGAAGGLGYGLRIFCGAEVVSGADLIAEAAGLAQALEGADLLITGEGRTDAQTASGKCCAVVASLARERGVGTLLLSGALGGDPHSLLRMFDLAFSISSGHGSLEACLENARSDLAFTAGNLARMLARSSRINR